MVCNGEHVSIATCPIPELADFLATMMNTLIDMTNNLVDNLPEMQKVLDAINSGYLSNRKVIEDEQVENEQAEDEPVEPKGFKPFSWGFIMGLATAAVFVYLF